VAGQVETLVALARVDAHFVADLAPEVVEISCAARVQVFEVGLQVNQISVLFHFI